MKPAVHVSHRASQGVSTTRTKDGHAKSKDSPKAKGNPWHAVFLEKVRFGKEVLGLSEVEAKRMAALAVKSYKEVDLEFSQG